MKHKMTERKLKINLEGLWENPDELFTIRYKDINTKYQQILAKRIKAIAPQIKLKAQTLENIEQALHEINPIIFSEYQRNNGWYRGHQKFGVNTAIYIAGYRFRSLCQAIYLTTCRKKALTTNHLYQITRLTHDDWGIIETYVNQRLGITEEIETITPIENLGIEDIQRAGQNVNRNNTITRNEEVTPDENYDTTPTEENQPGDPLEHQPPEWLRRGGLNPFTEKLNNQMHRIAETHETISQPSSPPLRTHDLTALYENLQKNSNFEEEE